MTTIDDLPDWAQPGAARPNPEDLTPSWGAPAAETTPAPSPETEISPLGPPPAAAPTQIIPVAAPAPTSDGVTLGDMAPSPFTGERYAPGRDPEDDIEAEAMQYGMPVIDPDATLDPQAYRLLPPVDGAAAEYLAVSFSENQELIVAWPRLPVTHEVQHVANLVGTTVLPAVAGRRAWNHLQAQLTTANTQAAATATPRTSAGAILPPLVDHLMRAGGSDLHVSASEHPWARVGGTFRPLEQFNRLTAADMVQVAREIVGDDFDPDTFDGDKDTSVSFGHVRFRVNLYRERGQLSAALRTIPIEIPPFEILGLPNAAKRLITFKEGLVIFAGATGSGKLLTLDTPIPTPSGVTTMGALQVGDEVLGRDGQPCQVTSLSEVNDTPDLFRVRFSDGQTVIADMDHQWLVATHSGRHAPRKTNRKAAIFRHKGARLDADCLDMMAASWAMNDDREAVTTEELFEVLTVAGLAGEFPSKVSVYNALRMTDCPVTKVVRPSTNEPTEYSRPEMAAFYPTRQVLEAIVAHSRRHKARAAEFLADDALPAEMTVRDIAAQFGMHTTGGRGFVYNAIQKAGIDGEVREFIGTAAIAADRAIEVAEYPAELALKCLAERLRQRFWNMPSTEADLSRMTTGEMLAAGVHLNTGHSNFSVPVTAALDLPAVEHDVDPYVLGAWLGDGHSVDGRFVQSDLNPTSGDQDTSDRDFLVDQLTAAGVDVTYAKGKSIGTNGLTRALRSVGVLGNKHIPLTYLRSSKQQRLAVLQGLMDTDGTIDANGNCELALSDRRLAGDALNLIRSLGIKASVSWDRDASYRDATTGEVVACQPRHRIHFTTCEPVFRLPRKAARIPAEVRETQQWVYITEIEPVRAGDPEYGPGRCITVDSSDHTYLCGDGYVVTSNSTSMASLLNILNESYEKHVVTIEKPIEYVHSSKMCMVHQREVGEDTESFNVALKSLLREDPDVVLLGEMRDYEEISLAIKLAETGHLVFTTVHAHNAAGVIDRVVDVFPSDQQNQIRTQLAGTLKGIVAQKLLPDAHDPRKRHLAYEIAFINDAIRAVIRPDDKGRIQTGKITEAVSNGKQEGMKSFDRCLAEMVTDGKIDLAEAQRSAIDPAVFQDLLDGLRTGKDAYGDN